MTADRHGPMTDEQLEELHSLSHGAQHATLDRDEQRRLCDLALHAYVRVSRARLVERLAWIAHWAADATVSTAPVALPHRLDPLWSYLHAVLDHGEYPDPARIDELEQLVWDEYDHQDAAMAHRASRQAPSDRTEDDLDLARVLQHHADEHLDQWDALTWESKHGRVWAVIERRKPDGYDGLWVELPAEPERNGSDGAGDEDPS